MLASEVAEQLSEKYNNACHEVRSLGLSHSAGEKLAKLLLEWSSKNGEANKQEPRLKLALTHEEIAQMIGTSRETVTRLFADLKKRQIVQAKGSTLVIRNKVALKAIATSGGNLSQRTPVPRVTQTGDSNHCAFWRRRLSSTYGERDTAKLPRLSRAPTASSAICPLRH